VVFDVDGTLVDTNYFHTLAWWRAFREHGHVVPMARIHRLIGMGSDTLLEDVLGRPDAAVDEAYSRHYHDFKDEIVPFEGAADLLQAVADRGGAVVLATSAKPEDVDDLLESIGAPEGVIDHVTSSGDAEHSKPAPDIFQLAMEGACLDPDLVVVIGDSVWDVEAAAKAGVPCVGVLTGGISEAELRDAGAVAVYPAVADLMADLGDGPLAVAFRSA
jgi:HAD superfamily hydrolase (TIGR01509 family)